jgi:hypothetical protein
MTKGEKIEEFLGGLNFENHIPDHVDCETVECFDDVMEQMQESSGFNIEIIYYRVAMEYLMENDCSLQESMELAEEYGYSLSALNSELLASLLASSNASDEFYKLKPQIDSFFEELEDEEFEEDEE